MDLLPSMFNSNSAIDFMHWYLTLLSDFNPNIYFGGDNVIFWGPLAWTVIFGITFATFLTLVIVPTMYFLIHLGRIKLKNI